MIEYINENMGIKKEPEYFYRVSEFVTTFDADPDKHEAFSYDEDFKGNDLLECRKRAMKYYVDRLKGFEDKSYFLPFASPEDFELGKNAAFSITLSLVEYYNDNDYLEYSLIGENDKDTEEGRELETFLLNPNSRPSE